MKFIKINSVIALLLCLCTLLCACGGKGEESAADSSADSSDGSESTVAEGKAEYSVTVKDGAGNPCTSGIVVVFMKDGEQAAMQTVNADGTAKKELDKGDYTVEIRFTDSDAAYYYDSESLALTADTTELTVVLYSAVKGEASSIHCDGKDYDAYAVEAGSTYVSLKAENRNFFLFTPTEAGLYEFSVSDNDAAIGYYGAPHFVQTSSAAEVKDNKFTISVKQSMIGDGTAGTSVFVVGLDATADGNGILNIIRIGDPEHSIEDEPWTVYKTTAQLAPYTVPAGVTLKNFDIKAASDAYNLVYNEDDGFYHLDSANGALVYVWLTVDPEYLACFKTILEYSGVSKYFFDEDGSFVKKENYAECLIEYFEYADEDKGVYPLTKDLEYIIKQRGDHEGWFDKDSKGYIFLDAAGNADASVNADIAWLFMCCYAD